MSSEIVVLCPHCESNILITEINCAIFRHGAYKENYNQMNPHERKEECDRLVSENLVFGCGKPFKLVKESEEYKAIVCDYI